MLNAKVILAPVASFVQNPSQKFNVENKEPRKMSKNNPGSSVSVEPISIMEKVLIGKGIGDATRSAAIASEEENIQKIRKWEASKQWPNSDSSSALRSNCRNMFLNSIALCLLKNCLSKVASIIYL